MTQLISQIVNVWRGSDGSIAEVVWDGSSLDAIEKWKCVDSLPDPVDQIATYFLLDDGTISNLPFLRSRGQRLPDRTGAVIIFDSGKYTKPDSTDHFPAPNNAAIFNADGSLRFQLKVSGLANRIAAFHSGSMPPRFASQMGLLIATHADAPPEWVYAVDPNSPELSSTGQWVRY